MFERARRAEEGGDQPVRFAQALFRGLPGRYDLLAEVLSFGQNRRWRRAMADAVVPAAPPLVLDVATGTAGVALELVRRTRARVVGLDISAEMVGRGLGRVAAAGADRRVLFVLGSAEHLPFRTASFPALTVTYLLRYVGDPAATLAELARVVAPGGVVASLEFHVPPSRFWLAWWLVYTRAVLPIAGLVAGGPAWYRVGRFLGPSISEHYRRLPLPETVAAWRAAGFERVEVRLMSLGGGVVLWGTRRDR